jgi:transposase InsO family protein
MRFRFIDAEKANYPVVVLCRVMEVTASGYYAWFCRGVSAHAKKDQELLEKIKTFYMASKGRYGSPRVHGDLLVDGERLGRKRVERLMRQNRLAGKRRRKFTCTTNSKHSNKIAHNLLNRHFDIDCPNVVWTSDITQLWTPEGWWYLAIVLDLFARFVVGWAMSSRIKRQLVMDAVRMALLHRQPDSGLIFHSDQGSQYAAKDTEKLLITNGITPSMSGKGNCFDNAVSESFFSRLKEELGDSFPSRGQANADVFEYIEVFFNRERRHSYNGNLTPLECEQFYACHGRRPSGIADLLANGDAGGKIAAPEKGAPIQMPMLSSTTGVPLYSGAGGLITVSF